MALAARWDLQLRQLDAVNAFPNSPLDEEVYTELPDGFKQPGMIGRLLRALYGLRRITTTMATTSLDYPDGSRPQMCP